MSCSMKPKPEKWENESPATRLLVYLKGYITWLDTSVTPNKAIEQEMRSNVQTDVDMVYIWLQLLELLFAMFNLIVQEFPAMAPNGL